MIKEEIAPGIIVYSDVISDSKNLCRDIEDGMVSAKIKWGKAYVRSGKEVLVQESSRSTETLTIPYSEIPVTDFSSIENSFNSNVTNLFLKSFSPIEKDYINIYQADVKTHETYSILKYGIGQNFVNHVDDHFEGPRRISHVHYLNEEYEGGEINFPRFGITYKPKANQSIFFPSGYVYNHSVSPVINGTRYAVVSWLF